MNAIAVYDKTREIMDGVGEGAQMGFLLGGTMGALTRAIQGKMADPALSVKDKAILQKALDEVEAFSAQHPDVPIYLVDVLAQRPLSNAIEATLGIRHESPQAFVFRQGAVVWHGSHRRVQRTTLAEQVTQAESASGAP
jgi:bacillithiol system protein YtxJ